MDQKISNIAQPSMQSLMLTMRFNGQDLSTGTGFVVNTVKGLALITNRHNVTGRNQETGRPLSYNGGLPNEIAIYHPLSGGSQKFISRWGEKVEPLYVDGNVDGEKLWKEHPRLGAKVDVVLLPLTQVDGIYSIPYAIYEGNDIKIEPAETVSVVGFPFGVSIEGRVAIWATGFIASEPDLDYNGLPQMLIDCRMRPGQSGSPVIARRSGMISLKNGSQVMANGTMTKFIGIYSGRINKDSDIGMVWKASAIQELINSLNPPQTLFKLWAPSEAT